MATYAQIYQVVNDISAQAFGEKNVSAIANTQDFISLGNYVLGSGANTDAFYQAIPDVIGRIITRYQKIKRRTRDIEVTPLDFGIILSEIEVDEIARAKKNRSWDTNIVNAWATQINLDSSNPPQVDDINGTSTDTGLDDTRFTICNYKALAGWEVDKMIYDYQLRTAFHSEGEMAAFINAIFQDMWNGMTQALNDAESAAEALAICQEIYGADVNGQLTAVNLAQAYFDASGTDITNGGTDFDAWKYSEAFLKFANFKITNDIKKAQQVSNFYTCTPTTNGGAYNLERELSDFRIHVLTEFASASEYYLLANTYHENFVKLGGYSEIVAWQGRKDANGKDVFSSNSSISVLNTDAPWYDAVTNPTGAYSAAGVVAHVFAYGRMISMIDHIRTKSQYNPIGERTVYAHKADIGYAVRPKEIGITYFIGEVDTGE